MAIRKYRREVSYEVSYVSIDVDNSVADLAAALEAFGIEDARWAVEPNYIVLTRQMSTLEVPSDES